MTPWDPAPTAWLMAGAFGGAIVSALVPWVNAEVLLLSALPLASSTGEVAGLVVAMTLGQMAGKSALYWTAMRSGTRISHWVPRSTTTQKVGRFRDALERLQLRIGQRTRSAVTLVLASAVIGVPPFYLVSVAAGACRLAFGWFLAAGLCGRLVHFALVACVPHLLWREL